MNSVLSLQLETSSNFSGFKRQRVADSNCPISPPLPKSYEPVPQKQSEEYGPLKLILIWGFLCLRL